MIRERESLTETERRVLALLAAGLDNTAIARKLDTTSGTVKNHIEAVYQKLRLSGQSGCNPRVLATLHYHGIEDDN